MRIESIRNFCIIAHIDHGKSTLADRLLQMTGAVSNREFREQLLDDMDLERERGITIKSSAVTLRYEHKGEEYELNLIDTPGHVDFSYEVSRSLSACEGALLVVDATQGVEAQTVANAYQAINHNLAVIPVVNKIDLASARSEDVMHEMETVLALDSSDAICVSAKEGTGIDELLPAIVERIEPPKGDPEAPLRALVFDSEFDDYRGVIVYVRVVDGSIASGDKVRMVCTGKIADVNEVGIFTPKMTRVNRLEAGSVGYVISNIRTIHDVQIGDTLAPAKNEDVTALPGYTQPQPMVFCGLYPSNATDFESLRDAIEKYSLNDSSFRFQPETSDALGFGFRCGFLGLLHMEIARERLERENNLQLIQTAPNVTYEAVTAKGDLIRVDNPSNLPDASTIDELREPIVRLSIIIPSNHIGSMMRLGEERRGTYKSTEYLSPERVMLTYEMPLAEIIYDFYDKLKSATRGYGTMDYELIEYRASDLVRLDILVAGKRVEAFSSIVHTSEADYRGRKLVQRLRREIPRHLFEIPVQAAVGSRIIARETIRALSKNVTAKCYGGDITRKRKLWEKQREGKKRMKSIGQVQVPQEAFLAVLDVAREE